MTYRDQASSEDEHVQGTTVASVPTLLRHAAAIYIAIPPQVLLQMSDLIPVSPLISSSVPVSFPFSRYSCISKADRLDSGQRGVGACTIAGIDNECGGVSDPYYEQLNSSCIHALDKPTTRHTQTTSIDINMSVQRVSPATSR